MPQLERVRRADRMADLGRDRHAVGKVVTRPRETAAALVAAPVEQAFDHGHAAHELRGMIAIRRHQDVVGAHRTRGANANRFLPERRGERADLSGALQRDCLGVERARCDHGAIKSDQRCGIGRERRQCLCRFALRIDELRIADLEGRNGRHARIPYPSELLVPTFFEAGAGPSLDGTSLPAGHATRCLIRPL